MSDESFSAAFFANLVAGNLQHVDENMVTKSASGPAKKINPAQFLPTQVMEAERAREQDQHRRLAEELNRQALQTHPHAIDESSLYKQQTPRVQVTTQNIKSDDVAELLKTFKSIDSTLKKLVKHITSTK